MNTRLFEAVRKSKLFGLIFFYFVSLIVYLCLFLFIIFWNSAPNQYPTGDSAGSLFWTGVVVITIALLLMVPPAVSAVKIYKGSADVTRSSQRTLTFVVFVTSIGAILAYLTAVLISGFGIALGGGDNGGSMAPAMVHSILSYEIRQFTLPFLVPFVISLVLLMCLPKANSPQKSAISVQRTEPDNSPKAPRERLLLTANKSTDKSPDWRKSDL